jgi:nucleoside-diphosphate-sugar epimerase
MTDTPGDEDSPIAPRDYYCYSKAEGEKVAREFVARGMDVVIVRPTSVYGPGDTRGWLKLFRLARKGWFLMVGSGRTLNHPVYVDNLVDLFELAGHSPVARGRTYMAGDDQAVTLTQLVRAVGRAVDREVKIVRFPFYGLALYLSAAVEHVFKALRVKPPVFRRRLSWFITNREFAIDRARDELGYRPRVALSEGLARSAAWYREHGYLAPAERSARPERRRPMAGVARKANQPERRLADLGAMRPQPGD